MYVFLSKREGMAMDFYHCGGQLHYSAISALSVCGGWWLCPPGHKNVVGKGSTNRRWLFRRTNPPTGVKSRRAQTQPGLGGPKWEFSRQGCYWWLAPPILKAHYRPSLQGCLVPIWTEFPIVGMKPSYTHASVHLRPINNSKEINIHVASNICS